MDEQTTLKIIGYLAPTVAYDNCLIGTRGAYVELVFLQYVAKNKQGELEANVVASVRLPNLQALKDFGKQISEHVSKEENREP